MIIPLIQIIFINISHQTMLITISTSIFDLDNFFFQIQSLFPIGPSANLIPFAIFPSNKIPIHPIFCDDIHFDSLILA